MKLNSKIHGIIDYGVVLFLWISPSLFNLPHMTSVFTYILGGIHFILTLKDYLVQMNSKSFMILVNGRIVMEEYFDGHTSTSSWPWNSAGKTLATTTTGIAEQEGLLNISTTKCHNIWARDGRVNL